MKCGACEERKKLSAFEKARSLARTMTNSVFSYVAGKPVYDVEHLAEERLKKCLGCMYVQKTPMLKCGICSCPLQGKMAKVKFVEADCPINKW